MMVFRKGHFADLFRGSQFIGSAEVIEVDSPPAAERARMLVGQSAVAARGDVAIAALRPGAAAPFARRFSGSRETTVWSPPARWTDSARRKLVVPRIASETGDSSETFQLTADKVNMDYTGCFARRSMQPRRPETMEWASGVHPDGPFGNRRASRRDRRMPGLSTATSRRSPSFRRRHHRDRTGRRWPRARWCCGAPPIDASQRFRRLGRSEDNGAWADSGAGRNSSEGIHCFLAPRRGRTRSEEQGATKGPRFCEAAWKVLIGPFNRGRIKGFDPHIDEPLARASGSIATVVRR